MLSEHRLTAIEKLQEELKIKDEKTTQFRNRFDLAVEKLLEKDNIIHSLRLEAEKLHSQLHKIKENVVGEKIEYKPIKQKDFKEKDQIKNFIDANDYILVCKKLKDTKTELEMVQEKIDIYKEQAHEQHAKSDELVVKNENLERKVETLK